MSNELIGAEIQPFISQHFSDDNGCPTGGYTHGRGFTVVWQNGALKEPELPEIKSETVGEPLPISEDIVSNLEIIKLPNGAFVEDLIEVSLDRLQYYQDSKFACTYNEKAIAHLKSALEQLKARTDERESRNVEGTHQV